MKKIYLDFPNPDSHYNIFLGKAILEKFEQTFKLYQYSKVGVLIDANLFKFVESNLANYFGTNFVSIIVPSGEQHKNLDTAQKIWLKLLQQEFDRDSILINFGGGVVTDLGGFVASTFMRGLKFINIPTSLLAQVDASVGGKTGVDLQGYKNLIGTFSQPYGVVLDTQIMATMPDRSFTSGLSEVLKHGLIADADYFQKIARFLELQKACTLKKEVAVLEQIVEGSVRIKSEIVRQDQKESGIRKILNFGHTIGHAVETFSFFTPDPLMHGEAISLGILGEAKISQLMGKISSKDFDTIKKVIAISNLPTKYDFEKSKVLEIMSKDKKKSGKTVKWTLLEKIGEAIYDQEVLPAIIHQGLVEIKT